MRSGKLIATNDDLVRQLCQDPDYHIQEDGTIYTIIQRTGKRSTKGFWRKLTHHLKKTKKDPRTRVHVQYKYKKLTLHRVVYQKFKGDLKKDLVINHIDGDTLNNHISNLELVTQKENYRHSVEVLGTVKKVRRSKLNINKARSIREEKKGGSTYGELAEKYGVSKATIADIVNNRSWKDE